MRLYKVRVLHGAPKDHHTATEEYFTAKTEEDAYEYVDKNHARWSYYYEDDEHGEWESKEQMNQELIENKGDLESEFGWEDAYYGITKWGWEEVCEIDNIEIVILQKLKILKREINHETKNI